MAFTLDTSGSVMEREPDTEAGEFSVAHWQWSDLSPFTQGYIEALFASDLNLGGNRTGEALCAFADLAPETLARIIADCDLYGSIYIGCSETADDGRTFWTSRTKMEWCGFPPLTVQLGDDGKVIFA